MSRKRNIKSLGLLTEKTLRNNLKLELIVAGLVFLALLVYRQLPITGSAASDAWQDPGSESRLGIQEEMMAEEPEPPGQSETDKPSIDMTLPQGRAGVTDRMPKPFALVDARNCSGLDYERVMYGKVETRSIWNGRRFVLQKVCIVQEGNGSCSVWSFDQNRDAVLLEVQK
jgi:hypothetical protein